MFKFGFGTKKFLGIDIGTSSVRVVELSKKGKTLKLENYGELDTSLLGQKSLKEVKKDDLLLSDKDIAKIIKSIYKEAGMSAKEVNFSIPDFRSFFTSFKMPVMAKEELDEAIRYEVRPYIPLPLSEITLDWIITEGKPSKTPLKILVVAIPNEIIAQYQEIARLSGLKLKALESEVFALARASYSFIAKPSQDKKAKNTPKVVGLIDIGARTSTCSIAEGGVLKTSHSFSLASNQLTERVAKSLSIDYNKAKEIREKQGLSNNIKKVLSPLVDSFIQDIKNTFNNFYREEGKEVERVILSGGPSLMPGIKEYFSDELKKETIFTNPFLNISYPKTIKETLERMGPTYAIGVGLAMKGLE